MSVKGQLHLDSKLQQHGSVNSHIYSRPSGFMLKVRISQRKIKSLLRKSHCQADLSTHTSYIKS